MTDDPVQPATQLADRPDMLASLHDYVRDGGRRVRALESLWWGVVHERICAGQPVEQVAGHPRAVLPLTDRPALRDRVLGFVQASEIAAAEPARRARRHR